MTMTPLMSLNAITCTAECVVCSSRVNRNHLCLTPLITLLQVLNTNIRALGMLAAIYHDLILFKDGSNRSFKQYFYLRWSCSFNRTQSYLYINYIGYCKCYSLKKIKFQVGHTIWKTFNTIKNWNVFFLDCFIWKISSSAIRPDLHKCTT